MKKATKIKVALVMVFAMIFTMFQGVFSTNKVLAASVWPSVTNAKYMKCFTLSTGNNTSVYSSSNLRTKIGTIYASDELHVYSINDSWAYLSYPTNKGRKYGYISTSVITKNNQGHSVGKAIGKAATYRRAGAIYYGYIEAGDYIMKVSASGNYTQIIYSAGSLWKMGWTSTANYNKYVSSVANQNNANANVSYSSDSSAGYVAKFSSNAVRCYTLASTGRVYAYSDMTLNNKMNSSYIACAMDECYIQSVNLTYGSVKLSYPTSSGRKSMFFRITDILASPSATPATYYADHKIYTYKWAGSIQYGYINCENVAVLGTSGAYTQILYSIGSGYYKIGFIKTSDMSSSGTQNSNPVNNTPANNGTFQNNIYNLAVNSVGTSGSFYQKWYGVSSSTPYCVIYAMYIARNAMANAGYSTAQINSIMPKYASTSLWAKFYNAKGRYYSFASWYNSEKGVRMRKNPTPASYNPKVGDLAAIDNIGNITPDHTGIVFAVNGNSLTMAEGNTGAGTNATRKVKIFTYYKSGSYWYRSDSTRAHVIGFGNPAY